FSYILGHISLAHCLFTFIFFTCDLPIVFSTLSLHDALPIWSFFAKAPVGTICGIGLSRARDSIYLCSLETKTALYFCFRVTNLFDAGIVVFNKLIICFYTTLTVCVSQVFGTVSG